MGNQLATVIQDLRYAVRMLLSNRAFTLVAVVALALGVGANTAIFSVVNAVLLRPLIFKDPDRLLVVRETNPPQFPEFQAAPGNFLDWQKQNTVFDQIEAYRSQPFNLIGRGEPERLSGLFTSPGLLGILGIPPAIGRIPGADEVSPSVDNLVILSYRLWQRKFDSDPNIIGQGIDLGGKSYTVVAVMRADFQFPDPDTQLYIPMAFDPSVAQNHGSHALDVIARLKQGVPLEQARTEMTTIAKRLELQYPETNKGYGVKLSRMLDSQVADIKPALIVLLGAVGLVLLIACANVANLLLARATARHKEIAIRTALGARRMRIIRQLLTESVLLALIGGAFGLLLARCGMSSLLALAPDDLPRVKDVALDGRVLGFTLLITFATGLIFGVVPALQASKPNLDEALRDGGRGAGGGGGRHLVRNTLVVFEIGMALVLLVGAGLMIKSFIRLRQVNPGFNPHAVLAAVMDLPETKYSSGQKQAAFFDELIKKVAALPGVQSVGVTNNLPFRSWYASNFDIKGRPSLPAGQYIITNYSFVSPDYFKTMGIPLLRGRAFSEHDNKEGPGVAIINEELARRFFPNEDPIGQHLRLPFDQEGTFREIVGIVGDVKDYTLDTETKPQTFEPFLQAPSSVMTLVVKTATDPAGLSAAIRARVLDIDKNQPISSISQLEQIVADSVAEKRFTMVLLGLFSALALILAGVGIYGVMAYSVGQRTHEVGIRMALGAQRGDVISLVVRQGMLLTGIGIVLGVVGAIALSRVMTSQLSNLLFSVSATDPLIIAAISGLLAVVALVACYVPARRASKVDPMVALRSE